MSSTGEFENAPGPDGQDALEHYLKQIGDRVRGLRAQRGMSRKTLSEQSDISERYLAQVETAKANISISLLWRVALAMDVELATLLPGSGGSGISLDPLRDLINKMDEEEEKEAFSVLLKHFARTQDSHKGLALIGLRGAGKTTLGRMLAEETGIPFVRMRDVIEELGGMGTHELFSLGGQKRYRRLEKQAIDHVAQQHDRVIIEAGGSLVSERETYVHLKSVFYTVWVKASPEEHMARVVEQGDFRPMEGNDDAMEDLKLILEERTPFYQAANYVLDTSHREVDDCFQEILNRARLNCGF